MDDRVLTFKDLYIVITNSPVVLIMYVKRRCLYIVRRERVRMAATIAIELDKFNKLVFIKTTNNCAQIAPLNRYY